MDRHTLIKIALIDTNGGYRKLLSKEINSWRNYRVIMEADDGADMLFQLEKSGSYPDVCLLEINMPRMDGYKTMTALNRKWPFLKILVHSVCEEEICVLEMLSKGARGYLPKSCNPTEVKVAIHEVHKAGYYQSGTVSNELFAISRTWKPVLSTIPDREREFLYLCCQDVSYEEIGRKMIISTSTVETYRNNLFKRFGVKSRSALIVFALRTGIITLNKPFDEKIFA